MNKTEKIIIDSMKHHGLLGDVELPEELKTPYFLFNETLLIADDSITGITNKCKELDWRVKNEIESILVEYLKLSDPPLVLEKLTQKDFYKIRRRGIKLIRKEDDFLGGMHYSIWIEQRGKILGSKIRVDYKDTGNCSIKETK